jgi:hypothetical protein
MSHIYRSALKGVRDADRRAQAMVSLCVGGMVLARTTNDPDLRRSLRRSARSQALALLDVPRNRDYRLSLGDVSSGSSRD